MNMILELLAGFREIFDEMSELEKERARKIKARKAMRHNQAVKA